MTEDDESPPILGKLHQEHPGQDFQLTRCHCGLLLLHAPCAECAAPAVRYTIANRGVDRPRDDGHTPALAAVLCLLVILWAGLRMDAAPDRQVDGQGQLG